MSPERCFEASVALPVSIHEAFEYHRRAGALQRLVPPWMNITIERQTGGLQPGSQIQLRMKIAGIPRRWVAEHTALDPPYRFEDCQLSGPFAEYRHEHLFEVLPGREPCSRLTDRVHYRPPLGSIGAVIGGPWIARQLAQMFAYRHHTTREDLLLFERYAKAPLRVAVSGSSGLVGDQLVPLLQLAGHHVERLVRHPDSESDTIAPWSSEADALRLEGTDAVIHLAGQPIADRRWSESTKRGIRDSRVDLTTELCRRLTRLARPPKVLLCASAAGFYGSRGEEWLDEGVAAGEGFLPSVCQQWEAACQSARDAGIRVVHLRFGMILSPRGGALAKSLLPAKLFGGSLGGGQQWWSWIAMDDCIGAIYHCLQSPQVAGPVNVCTPDPVRNREFAQTLARVLRRSALLPAPAAALRLALGEMADGLLLASVRMRPDRLEQTGYVYRFPMLEPALRHLLGAG